MTRLLGLPQAPAIGIELLTPAGVTPEASSALPPARSGTTVPVASPTRVVASELPAGLIWTAIGVPVGRPTPDVDAVAAVGPGSDAGIGGMADNRGLPRGAAFGSVGWSTRSDRPTIPADSAPADGAMVGGCPGPVARADEAALAESERLGQWFSAFISRGPASASIAPDLGPVDEGPPDADRMMVAGLASPHIMAVASVFVAVRFRHRLAAWLGGATRKITGSSISSDADSRAR